MNESTLPLLQSFKHVMAARGWLEGIPGVAEEAFGDSALREIAFELEHLGRRLRNVALARGVSAVAVATIEEMHSAEALLVVDQE